MICGTGPTAVLHVLAVRHGMVRYGMVRYPRYVDRLTPMHGIYMMPKHDRLCPKQAQVWKRAALRGRGFRPLFRSLSLSLSLFVMRKNTQWESLREHVVFVTSLLKIIIQNTLPNKEKERKRESGALARFCGGGGGSGGRCSTHRFVPNRMLFLSFSLPSRSLAFDSTAEQ